MPSDATKTAPPPDTDDEADAPHYLGHRQRLRDRFLKGGAEALADYELLELLLFLAIPRRDVKPLAKALIRDFGSLQAVLGAETERLATVDGLSENAAVTLKIVAAAARSMTREQVIKRNILTSWDKLIDYCRTAIAHEPTERFHLLFLDRKNVLIADEMQQEGTVDHTPVYPREVVKRALELNASAIIMVHNHPSGDTAPSRADIEMTKRVREALAAVNITLHDHLVIGRAGHTSFKATGLL